MDLNPRAGLAQSRYSNYFEAMGRMDDAIAESKHAREVEPLLLIIGATLGRDFFRARQYDQAIAELGKSLDLDPNFAQAHLYLGWVYEQQKRYEEAIVELQKGVTLSGGESEMAGALGHAYAVSGKRAEAEKALLVLKERSTQHYVAPFDIALIYAGLAAKNSMFEWLEKAYEDHSTWLIFLKVDPRFASLRDDPRYHDLLRRMKLPD
jgi:tetratricopeptide (TPR) repeat protein